MASVSYGYDSKRGFGDPSQERRQTTTLSAILLTLVTYAILCNQPLLDAGDLLPFNEQNRSATRAATGRQSRNTPLERIVPEFFGNLFAVELLP
jgi:hypothetical protein